MSGAAGEPQSSSPYGKKGSKTTMYALVAIMLVVGLVVGYFIGAALAKPAERANANLDEILKRGKLIVASDTTWPPFEIYNSTSQKYEGVDIEIVERIAAELGVQLEIKPMSFDAVIGAVQSGQADLAISSITILPERAKAVDFSIPYYSANQGVLVKEGSAISSAADLAGKKVGAQLGTTGLYWAQDNLPTSIISQYQDIPSAVVALEQGQIDAVICDTPVANNYADDPSYTLKVGFTIVTNEEYGIAIAKGNTALKFFVDRVLQMMKDDGSLQAILVKWNAD
ncbi:MAG: basic amino acid ABC transporter substrate-binding protein [Methanomassiliicoccales archaeon]